MLVSQQSRRCECVMRGCHQEAVKLTPRSTDAVSIYPAKACSRRVALPGCTVWRIQVVMPEQVPEPFQVLQGSWCTEADLQTMGAGPRMLQHVEERSSTAAIAEAR